MVAPPTGGSPSEYVRHHIMDELPGGVDNSNSVTAYHQYELSKVAPAARNKSTISPVETPTPAVDVDSIG